MSKGSPSPATRPHRTTREITKCTKYFQHGKDIHHQQGGESRKHLGLARPSAAGEGGSGAAPDDLAGATREVWRALPGAPEH